MDATQMINDSVLESDEEENNDREDALGKLCILKNQHIPEKECPLYLGENILGRDPNTCSVSLPAPSVSKQHATISLSVYRRKGGGNEVEALLWDMGSMNGTRKGHIKLTPNVRYALSEGDIFVVADITCKYTKCTTDYTRPPVTPNLKTRDVFKENGGNLHTSNTKCPVTSTKLDGLADAEGTGGTPARTSGLSFEQTPTQPQSFLVPDSESESEEDKSRTGDERRKAKVSDSDSHKSSPICSTFMSLSNKVVPESEDESPITPSSSYKNRTRCVSFNMESDSDSNRQERKKTKALDIVDDSEEETGNNNGSVQPKLSKVESNATIQADTVSKFNMDSDTDVEEEEEEKQTVTTATVMSSNPQATEHDFHMDSDTDVEDDDNNEPKLSDHAILSDNVPKNSQTAPVLQPKEICMDSDTDVEEEEEKPSTTAAPETSTNVQVSPNAAEFNIDSDTDVEDEDLVSAAKAIELQSTSVEMPKTSANPSDFNLDSDTDVDEGETDITPETPSRLDVKSLTSKSATPLGVQFDSDTEDEGILNVPVTSKPPEDLEILANSDTDVEDDFPDVKPTTSGLVVAQSTGTGVNKSVVSSSTKDKPAALSVDSDTDVEDNEVEIRETEDKMPVLQRETTPGIQDVLLKNCSTPIQQQAGNLEEMETQAFLSPSISAYRRAVAPQRTDALSSCSSQEDDYVVAETQSFILSDRAQDPNISLGSSVKDLSNSSGGNFQLELSDSSVLQCQAQTLALESTQAFINANLEETQPYADAVITEEKNTTVDIALQATQAYFDLQDSDKEAENAEGGREGEEEEATQPLEFLSVAPTQPMCVEDDSDDEDSAPVFRQKKAKQIEEQETQRFSDVTVAPTQPMEIQDSETDENPIETEAGSQDITVAQTVNMEILEDSESESAVFRKDATKSQENETQQNSDFIVAQTMPMGMPEDTKESSDNGPESDEDSTVIRKKGSNSQEEETQQNSDLIVAQTVPMEMPEDTEESSDNGPVFCEGTAKQLQSEEEATQSIAAPKSEGTDDEDSGPMFRKRNVKCIARIEDTQPSLESEITKNPAQPIPATVEDSIPVEEQRTQPVDLSDDGESDKEDVIATPRKRKARKLEDTQSLISQFDTEDTKDGGEVSNVGLKARRGGTRLKEKQEEVAEPTKRQTRGKSKVAHVSKGRRGRAKVEPEESEEDEEGENKMAAKLLKEKNGKEMMERQKREKQEKERLEKEQKEREEMERLEKQKEQEEKERRENVLNEKLEKERIKQEKKELAVKLKKEKEEKKQENLKEMQRLEREKRERAEDEQKEMAENANLVAAKKQEEVLQKQQEEKERLEKDDTKGEAQAQSRGRRTGRRTTAIPDSSTVADEDDVPAKRTRSRSNSSNSVCSERSVSSSVSQTSRGRGRGRGARKMEVEKTPSRGRRRTVVAAKISTPSPPRMLSRSNSNTSLNSEFSVSSLSLRGRGRGGRQRGRGRMTGIECANDQVSTQKATQRGRKSARICPEDEEDKGDNTQSSLSTRGKRRAKDTSTKCTPEDEEGTASTSSTERKGGRAKQVETKKDLEKESLNVEENGEAEDASFNGKRKAAARNTPARKNMKVTEDITKSDKPKGKGCASTVQSKNSKEQGDSGSSANSMEPGEPPQTPRSSVSRKRSSGDSESDTLAKTPRSSTASPSTGRSRTASQAYKVLFTGVVDEAGEKVLTRLGGEIAKDVSNMNCLVTDKVRRTVKFLCAVAKGIPIVTTQWLEKSGKAGTFLSPHAYLVKDREQENKFDFNLQESLRVASSQPLLQGYKIHVTKSVKPEPVHMKDIISCSGAVFLPKMPSSNKPNTVVISCEEDWSLCAPALSCGLPVVSSEFILTGILQQKLDLEIHKLSSYLRR